MTSPLSALRRDLTPARRPAAFAFTSVRLREGARDEAGPPSLPRGRSVGIELTAVGLPSQSVTLAPRLFDLESGQPVFNGEPVTMSASDGEILVVEIDPPADIPAGIYCLVVEGRLPSAQRAGGEVTFRLT